MASKSLVPVPAQQAEAIVIDLGRRRDYQGRQASVQLQIDVDKLVLMLLGKAIAQGKRHGQTCGKTRLQSGAITLTAAWLPEKES